MERTILGMVSIGIVMSLAGCGVSQQSNNNGSTPTATNTANATMNTTPVKPTHQPVKLTKNNWINIHMVNDRVGWGVIYSTNKGATVVRTIDGGKSWYEVSPHGTSSDTPNGVDYVNGNSAWITIQPVLKSSGLYERVLMIYHTEDGGKTWQSTRMPLHSQFPVYKTHISIVDSEMIYMDVIPQHGMSGMPGQLMVSHDAGQSWSTVRTANNVALGGDVQFTSPTTGWLSTADCTTCNRQLFETTNGGTSWNVNPIPIPNQYKGDQASLSLPTFSSTNPTMGILAARFETQGDVVEHRAIYSTNNAGKSWSFISTMPGQAGLTSFPSTTVGIAIPLSTSKTYPALYETTNSGASWTDVGLPKTPFSTLVQDYTPAQLDFISKNVGWIVWGPRIGGTATNQIWETKNGGHTWTKVFS